MTSDWLHHWVTYVAYVFLMGHITTACVSVYLHRSMAHRSVTIHPLPAAIMRTWLWLFTGMDTKEWTACHRKHHAYVDQYGDPHSPVVEGFLEIFLFGVFYYQKAVKDAAMVEQYGKGPPDDWLERHVFRELHVCGIFFVLLANALIFGVFTGTILWAVQRVWTPFWAAGVVNGIGHAWGYRNFKLKDASRNFAPIAIWLAGEELHNNHHANPSAPKFSVKWWEFDIGWSYIRLLLGLRLAQVIAFSAGKVQPALAAATSSTIHPPVPELQLR